MWSECISQGLERRISTSSREILTSGNGYTNTRRLEAHQGEVKLPKYMQQQETHPQGVVFPETSTLRRKQVSEYRLETAQ